MLEGKALVVAIMMLTAAPLVVTDDGRAIVGDVTRDVTDMFIDSEPLPAEDPKLDEVLDDAKDKTNEKDRELERKELAATETKEEKSCYYLEEIKEEMMEGKEGWDKEDKWETEEDFFAALEKLSAECDEGNEDSCEKLAYLREELAEDREEESEEREDEERDEEESDEREGSRSGDETESEEDNEKDELDEEFIAEMEELKEACGEGNEESCEELREMVAELMTNRKDDIQLVIGEDGVVYYEERKDKDWDREDKDWDKEEKDWDEACLTMEEWEEVFEKDRKEKESRHKDGHKKMNMEDFMYALEQMDEEEISEIKQITNISDEEWDEMVVKMETKNMTEEDWKTVMQKMKLVFDHEMKEEHEEMEAFRAQMKEFDDACEAGNETACEELAVMMEEIGEDFREDKEDKEGCNKEESEEESEEESNDDESDEDEEDLE